MSTIQNELLNIIKQNTTINLCEYQTLKSKLYNNLFNKIPVITNVITKGQKLYRTTKVDRKDLTLGRKKYLSYRPQNIDYPFFNRCSEPNQSHFYCSTDRHLSMAECSYFISVAEKLDVLFDRKSEILEVGVWEVMEDLFVADFRFGTFSPKNLMEIQVSIKKEYNNFAKEEFIKDYFDHINQSFEAPINKDEHLKYWLTACYSNYIFDDEFRQQFQWSAIDRLDYDSNLRISGILYHSVKGIKTNPPMVGENLALRTNLIDQNIIRLRTAGLFESKQIEKDTFALGELIKFKKEIITSSWYYY